jgi:Rrf2 family protein
VISITVRPVCVAYARHELYRDVSPSIFRQGTGLRGKSMLSKTSQYAIRALSCLARMQSGETVLGRKLSEQASVPPNYLSKIMLVLRNAGLVEATRGAGGGYRLGRSPSAIRLLDIVSPFDSSVNQLECVLGVGVCNDDAPCPAHTRWKQVRSQFVGFLEGTTLAELVEGEGRK